MSWWPPWRPRSNGRAAAAARAEADAGHREAEDRTPQIDRIVRDAEHAVARADQFAREVERAMRVNRRRPA